MAQPSQAHAEHNNQAMRARLADFHACCAQFQPARQPGQRASAVWQQQLQDIDEQQIRSLQTRYEPAIMHSIFYSIKALGLLPFDQHGKTDLSQLQFEQLMMHPLLTQLRILSMLVTQYRPGCSLTELFDSLLATMHSTRGDTSWLERRHGLPQDHRLSLEALKLLEQLAALNMLAPDAVPQIAAQVSPDIVLTLWHLVHKSACNRYAYLNIIPLPHQNTP